MSDEEHSEEAEAVSLQLVRDVQRELAAALDSLGKTMMSGAYDRFINYSARHVNRATEGYIVLRESRRIDASKLLVRPVIETMFRLKAVHEKPTVFYRVLLKERVDRRTWLRALARNDGQTLDAAKEQSEWDSMRQHCASTIPGCDLTETGLSLCDVASAAGLNRYYDSHYRFYCMFTHGALEAVVGTWDNISDAEDNYAIAFSAFSAAEVLENRGASAPNLAMLKLRLWERHLNAG